MTEIVFDHTATGYQLAHARCLAHAARLAYEDEAEIEATAHGWGFDRVRSFQVPFQPPFPLQDTQAYTMAGDDMIVTAFRGTEPTEIRDWLSDAGAPMVPHQAGRGSVHWGFDEALDAVYPGIRDAVREFRTGGQTVWFTGHSLGGALAMLAAARVYFSDGVLADGVHTFGQPRTCDADLAEAYDEAFGDRMFRFVNNNDVVAQVPPEPVYRHVAEMRYIDARGRVHEERMSLVGGLADSFRGHTADPFSPGADGVRDHSMDAYVERLDAAAL
ncbi:lipase family protein [Nocardiopsis dassonvillei]|uniref:lipase family protein n=1 Tax=Nocardiopsis dassonvillei TaxID=2014 RepID=UPI00102BB2D6|nr:lipase family protein [Nocardiopsis dassonvillei]MCP3016960.1 lipase family protein [Nocardiopsis dassonvillei]